MTAPHLEILVEDESMEAFLRSLLPRVLPDDHSFQIHPFQGKPDLLSKLQSRLSAYADWLPENFRLVVLVDRDDDDCRALKRPLESAAKGAKLRSRSRAGGRPWQLVNRIAEEELEAWYFGDWPAVRAAYPRVPQNIPNQSKYRNPDKITGGTWEAFERILQRRGYFRTGLQKKETARKIGGVLNPNENRSHSFAKFLEAILEASG